MNRFFLCVIIYGFCINISVCLGQDDGYQQAYDTYDQGLYRLALTQFEALLSQDAENPALIYNIALCHHEIKQFDQAEFYFTRLLDSEEYADWATYQLAINDWQKGFYGAAEIGLMQVVFHSNDADLVELATLRYQELLNALPTSQSAKSFWGTLSLGYGSDNNIVDPRFLNTSDQKDNFSEISASGIKQWNDKDGLAAWQWRGYLLMNRFQEFAEADLNVYSTELQKLFYAKSWQVGLGLGYEFSQSGDKDYLERTVFELTARSNGKSKTLGRWLLDYQFSVDRALDSAFDQLAGDSHELNIEYQLSLSDSWYWRLRGGWEHDDREATVDLNLQSDLSATRIAFGTTLVGQLNRWVLELGVENRSSDYGKIRRIGSVASVDRQDDRMRWLLRADYEFTDAVSAYLELQNVDNESNIPRFTYQQRSLSGGISWQF